MPNPPLIALDTNVLIDLADKEDTVLDCIITLRDRLPLTPVIILPTVIQELADIADHGDTEKSKASALKALQSIRNPWGFHPINCVPVGHGIVEQTARKIRAKGLLPEEEVNDSFIIAEAALANITLLLSSDGHFRHIDQAALKLLLDECDIGTPAIFSPWKIVNNFG